MSIFQPSYNFNDTPISILMHSSYAFTSSYEFSCFLLLSACKFDFKLAMMVLDLINPTPKAVILVHNAFLGIFYLISTLQALALFAISSIFFATHLI